MKKTFVLAAVCLAFAVVLTACKAEHVEDPMDPLTGNQTKQEHSKMEECDTNEYPICVQHIRTNGYNEGIDYPRITVVRSQEELNRYYEANKNLYDLEHKETVYSDTTASETRLEIMP